VSAPIQEYFALFGLPPRFAIDADRLNRAYREVLGQVHPDRHVGGGAGAQRAAMQMASLANQAYGVLRAEVSRAAYLCAQRGAAPDAPGAAATAPAFLEQQMQWREALEDARVHADGAALAALAHEVAGQRAALLAAIALALDERDDPAGAAVAVRCLMFVDKLTSELERARSGDEHDGAETDRSDGGAGPDRAVSATATGR